MEVKDRLKLFLKTQNITQLAFCNALDVSTGYISSMRKSISPDKLSCIAAKYPQLNITWLLTGQGEMLKPGNLPTAPTTIENSVVNSGSDSVINNNGGDETFWKGLVNELRERIADLKTKCDEKDAQIKAFEELIEEARQENERLKGNK